MRLILLQLLLEVRQCRFRPGSSRADGIPNQAAPVWLWNDWLKINGRFENRQTELVLHGIEPDRPIGQGGTRAHEAIDHLTELFLVAFGDPHVFYVSRAPR